MVRLRAVSVRSSSTFEDLPVLHGGRCPELPDQCAVPHRIVDPHVQAPRTAAVGAHLGHQPAYC
jgi:hypothetical protein